MNKTIEKFEDLNCWKKSRELTNLIYEICEEGNLRRDYSTKDQIKRASLAIMNNIAEGFGRFSKKEFIRFLDIASASGMEVRSMLYILKDRKYIDEEMFDKLYEMSTHQSNMTLSLIKYLKNKLNEESK